MSALEVKLGCPLLSFSLLFLWVKTFVLRTLTSPGLWYPQHLAPQVATEGCWEEGNIAESLVYHNIAFSFIKPLVSFSLILRRKLLFPISLTW